MAYDAFIPRALSLGTLASVPSGEISKYLVAGTFRTEAVPCLLWTAPSLRT